PAEVLTFPHLVFRELIALMVFTLVLVVISIVANAPLEEIATPSKTPNPAKAPWYFVGLQEMLVYFDPWIAGVVAPTLIIIGLTVIPYVDRNPRGVGRYAFRERPFAVIVFTIGVFAWFALIVFGFYFRGPSWLIYMPWESWEIHKPILSTGTVVLPFFMGTAMILVFYALVMVLPIIFLRNFYRSLGPTRYFITMSLVATMFGFFIKIPLRFIFDIKYIIQTPWFSI
ncbi:MAG: hypothetical protein V3W51_03465, partial [Candidatus Brocadiales bacterium]